MVKLPIVAIGGVGSLDDVLDFLFAGAVAVQVGTAVFADPVLPLRLVDELEEWCRANGHGSHRDVVGVALPERRSKPSVKGVNTAHDRRLRRDLSRRRARRAALRRVGRLSRGPLQAQEWSPRRSLHREVPGPAVARASGRAVLADGQPGTLANPRGIDVVVGPTTGGVILSYEVARQLGVRGFFAEQVTDAAGATRREFRRGFTIEAGERVLLVDDVVTTGASLLEMVPLIEATGGELMVATVIVDRSGELGEIESPTTGRRYRATRCGHSRCQPTSPAPPHAPAVRRRCRSSRQDPAEPRADARLAGRPVGRTALLSSTGPMS